VLPALRSLSGSKILIASFFRKRSAGGWHGISGANPQRLFQSSRNLVVAQARDRSSAPVLTGSFF
jgi:hypothetical protein